MTCFLSAAVIVVAAVALPGVPLQSEKPGLAVIDAVDLQRYMGTWYEIGRLPNRFQDHCIGDVVATYALRSDGRVDVINRCRTKDGTIDQARGVARRVGNEPNGARLKVRFAPAFLSFLPMVWGDYWIIGLGAEYDWAVIAEPSRKYLWILSRTPTLPDVTIQRALEIAKAQGYDISALIRTKHGR